MLPSQARFSFVPQKTHPDFVVGFDTETWKITRGRIAPRMVCGSWHSNQNNGVLDGERFINEFEKYLDDSRYLLVAHMLQFDLAVICAYAPRLIRKIFEALRDNRFSCTKIRQTLLDIAEGTFRGEPTDDGSWHAHGYGLDDLAARHGLQVPNKSDEWRLKFGELDGIPAEQYPPEATAYSLFDSVTAQQVYFKQNNGQPVLYEAETCRHAFALQLASVWGIRSDAASVNELERVLTIEANTLMAEMQKPEIGIYRKDRTKDTKRLKLLVEEAFARMGLTVPQTDKGNTKTDADTLQLSADPVLMQLGDGQGPFKLLNTFIPALKAATEIPLQPGYEVLVITGRTASKNPTKKKKGEIPVGINIQQLPKDRRDDDGNILLGIRNCFRARGDFLYCSSDYNVAELRALGEVHYQLFGRSALRDAFIKGIDPHLVMAATILGKPLDWVVANKKTREVKDARTFAKIGNFGVPGGLGPDSLVSFARSTYKTIISRGQAEFIIENFHRTWPEQRMLFRYVSEKIGQNQGPITQVLGCPLVHGARRFTQGSNLLFQGAVAQVAKEAVWRTTWEMYLGTKGWRAENDNVPSPLFGSRISAFIHDEILAEILAPGRKVSDAVHRAAMRLSQVMCETQLEYFPNTPAVAEPALMEIWDKDAETWVGKDGLLEVWSREEAQRREAAAKAEKEKAA